MTPLERLRLATALAHTVPGTELRLVTDSGEQIVVSRHPAADIDACKMRQVVAASACPRHPDLSRRIGSVMVGGALVDLGGGVFGSRSGGLEHRWVASLLPYPKLSELLDDVGHHQVPADAMRASLKPDPELGVTVISVTSNHVRFDHALDEVAAEVAAACFVAELCSHMATLAHSDDRIEGAS